MELYQLKSFVKIAQTHNLRKAAENLHISQSALSSQIKLLEERLDLKLFTRTAKGMVLTDNGRILYSHAQEILSSAEIFTTKAKELSGRVSQTVRIGINTDGGFLKVGKLSRTLNNHFPQVNFIFVSSQTIRTAEMLREKLIDVGFFFGDNFENDIYSETISHFHIQIAIPKKILPDQGEISWQILADLPWIWSVCNCPYYQIVQEKMETLGLNPNRFVDAMDESVVKELVMDGQGIAILREDEAQYVAGLSDVHIWKDVKFQVPLCVGILKSNRQNNMLDTITGLIRPLWSK